MNSEIFSPKSKRGQGSGRRNSREGDRGPEERKGEREARNPEKKTKEKREGDRHKTHRDWDTQTRLTAAAGRAETCRQTHRYTHTRIWTDTLVYRYIHLWHNT